MNWLTVLKISGVFVAFLIGSGFASGQEILQFFAVHGIWGMAGGLIFLVLAIYLTVTLLLVGKAHGFKTIDQTYHYYAGTWLGRIFSWYTTFMMFSVYVLMLSGAGTVVNESYGAPVFVGSGLLAALVFGILYFGLHRLVEVLGLIGPGLILLIVFIAVATVISDPEGISRGDQMAPDLDILKVADDWWFSALLYTSVQIAGLFSFMPALGSELDSKKEAYWSGVIGPVTFFVALVTMIGALLVGMPETSEQMIPSLYLALQVAPWLTLIFSVIILAGIFTTASPLLWVVVARFGEDGTRRYRLLALVLSLVGYFGGMLLPFDELVNLIYPTVGYTGLILITCMFIKQVRNRSLV